jgi:putative transposase
MLDCSIKMACASFKTGLTNYLEGNSGMFKIRYWSNDRPKKVLEIEKCYIGKDGFICKGALGKMLMYECKSNKWIEYKLEKGKAIKLHYDSKTDTYSLFVPKDEKTVKSKAVKDSFVGLDAGIRTFMSCMTNEKAIQFGTKMYRKISNLLSDIDIINNDIFLSGKQKSKRNMKIYNRINNIVDEMHWKIINYLTNNYERIYIGILNMKDVVNNDTSVISNMSKRVGLMMKHFQFRQRLIFKCKSKRIQCIEVNERYTSKTCSVCGGYKKDLGGNKIYDCDSCTNLMDRDMNASRCILLKNTK